MRGLPPFAWRRTSLGGIDPEPVVVFRASAGMGPYASYIVETFVTLLAVCSLAFLVLFGARKMGVGRAKGPIELVGQLPLDARRQIVLVRVGGQVLVVGVGEGGFAKLGELPASDVPAVDVPTAAPFSEVIARVTGSKRRSAGRAEGGEQG